MATANNTPAVGTPVVEQPAVTMEDILMGSVDTTTTEVESNGTETVEEQLTVAQIVARQKQLGAKVVKVQCGQIRTYTNENGFVSLIFNLKKAIPTLNSAPTTSYFEGWKTVRAILVEAGYEQFATLLDFDVKDNEAEEAKRKQRLTLALSTLLPNCTITLLQREIHAGDTVLSNPFSTRNDEQAYFVPTTTCYRYNAFAIELSAKAKAFLSAMEQHMIAKASDLLF